MTVQSFRVRLNPSTGLRVSTFVCEVCGIIHELSTTIRDTHGKPWRWTCACDEVYKLSCGVATRATSGGVVPMLPPLLPPILPPLP